MPEPALPFPLPVVPPRFTPLTAAAQNRRLAQKLYTDFFNWPIERSRKILETTPPEVWEREGQRRALQVFHAAAERVPAYRDFLKKHRVDHEKVRTIADFQKVVPVVDKKNYLRRYKLADLCWDGVLLPNQMTSVSSGSTGEPFFWPRGTLLELETTYLFELLYEALDVMRKPTLLVNAFAMGMYVGGPFALNASLRIAQKGSGLGVVTPGYALEEILKVTPLLGRNYSQVLLASYPPFAKTIIDEGRQRGIEWRDFSVRFLLAGEGFNETWRDYIAELAGGRNSLRDFISLYGTADAAVLAFETPTSIWIRRYAAGQPQNIRDFFGEERLPSLLNYAPTLRYFEALDRKLVFTTGSTGMPLIRYDIGDYGGVLPVEKFVEKLRLNSRGPFGTDIGFRTRLPLVYLFGRRDFTAILYGANIYPENVKSALEDKSLRRQLTGKFTMWIETDRRQDQYLLINIECSHGIKPTSRLRRDVRRVTVETLMRLNSEYRVVARALGSTTRPRIKLFSKGSKDFSWRGIKHRWANKK